MSENPITLIANPRASTISQSTAALLGRVMSLVALTIGIGSLGAAVGRNLGPGAALTVSIIAIVMLLVQAFGGAKFRVGRLAVAWLILVAFMLGLGLGPTITYYASTNPAAVVQAAATTALVVVAVATVGFATSRDLAAWLRVLSWVVLGVIVAGTVLLLVGAADSPVLSLGIAVLSALLILVDFNYLRHHGTDDDAVILATGIFVSIVNLFVAIIDLFQGDSR